ncbi:MAG: M55 family metallopeptidase [Gemmatimonadales bacterium]
MRIALLLPAVAALAACTGARRAADAATEPWTAEPAAIDTTDGIRILVLHDMEGLAGEDDPNQFFFGKPEYPHGQELLAADLNAVIEGLFQGGATAVDVVDGHGSGNPEPDVRRDLLDPRAQQVFRDQPFDSYFDLVTPGAYDAVAVVGMHAKTGSRGFASHTITLGIGVELNGRMITETELVAASWGRQRVPLIFASGDDRLAADLATLPWIEFVTVKTAHSADSVALRPVAEARTDLTAAARRAVENYRSGKTRAVRVREPVRAGVRAVHPASLALLDGVPGIDYADSTVRFTSDSLGDAYRAIETLVGVATAAYSGVLSGLVSRSAGGPELMGGFLDTLVGQWFDYESGRWQAPTRPTPSGRFHGPR